MSPIKQLAQRELRNNISSVLRAVENGDAFRITVHGHPIADLIPVREKEPETFVAREKILEFCKHIELSKDNAAAWAEDIRRDASDISVDPWSA